MRKARGQNTVNLLLGVWLFVTPWIFDYSLALGSAQLITWNFWLVGAAVAISAAFALRDLRPWEEWTNLLLGIWVFFSPWTLGFSNSTNLFWNAIVVGLAVVAFSGAALPVAQRRIAAQRI